MATPLAQLLDAVLFDGGVRDQFRLSPETFLRSAGYSDLDAADVQEALFVLAEGSASARAAQLVAGGQAIGDPTDLDGLGGTGGDFEAGGLAAAGGSLVTALDAIELDDTQLDDPEPLDNVGVEELGVDVTSPRDEAQPDSAFGVGTAAEESSPEPHDQALDEAFDEAFTFAPDVSAELDAFDPLDAGAPPSHDDASTNDATSDDATTDDGTADDWTDFEI